MQVMVLDAVAYALRYATTPAKPRGASAYYGSVFVSTPMLSKTNFLD